MTFTFLMLHPVKAAALYNAWLHFYPPISSEDCCRAAVPPDFLGYMVMWKAIECLRILSLGR